MGIEEALIMGEVLEVKKLGERIGYGNLMELASALWRKKLRDHGSPEIGALVPAILQEGKRHSLSRELYDEIVEKYLGIAEKELT